MITSEKELLSDYKSRLNRVFEFIDENLNSKLSLKEVAEVAYFSPYHFHRVFKYIVQETLNEYIIRRKIEKSALELLHTNASTTAVAHNYGYSDNSSFAKAFKKYYGISPTEFKKQNIYKHSKILQLESKNGQGFPNTEKYICFINNLKNWITMNAKIEVKKLPEMNLAYVTCIGSKSIEGAFNKLIKWATSLGLMNEKTKLVTIYHDSFKVTEAEKVRISASILLEEPIEPEGEVALTSIEAGKFIVGSFEIKLSEFEKSWTGLFLWMNENGYKKAEGNPFEIYYNNFNEHPQRKARVDFCIPVQ